MATPRGPQPTKQWALWNYGTLWGTFRTRRDAVLYGAEITIGGFNQFEKDRRDGCWTIGKVIITPTND